jgi:arsenite methyltransferase
MSPTETRTVPSKQTPMESAVRDRYAQGARAMEPALCCPTEYSPQYLKAIPQEVLDRDYGCGDPSQYLKEGETVLDLGSGTGKICFIAAQVVGPKGRVIGVDMTSDMLCVARSAAPRVADALGFGNVEFKRGRIQDLRLDLDHLDEVLSQDPATDSDGLFRAQALAQHLRKEAPLIPDASVDVVVSNCVLNLVDSQEKADLFKEIHRVLRRGGRAVISDIVSDEEVPDHLKRDAHLWSGCISGALTEDGFLRAFERAGFYGVRILSRQSHPWQTVEGIEFRSMTVEAFRGKEGACFERRQAVIYKGPFREVKDDDGHTLRRGDRVAVCDKTFQLYAREPYREHFERVEPMAEVPLEEALPFDCTRTELRHPRETKGADYTATTDPNEDSCGPDGCC